MFMLDLLDNLSRLRLSDDHLKAIIWVMKECGTPNVPSFYALRKMQAKLTRAVGLKPKHHTSALQNQFYMNHPNDLIHLMSVNSSITHGWSADFMTACLGLCKSSGSEVHSCLSGGHNHGFGVLAGSKICGRD
jgi:hypothetical protein